MYYTVKRRIKDSSRGEGYDLANFLKKKHEIKILVGGRGGGGCLEHPHPDPIIDNPIIFYGVYCRKLQVVSESQRWSQRYIWRQILRLVSLAIHCIRPTVCHIFPFWSFKRSDRLGYFVLSLYLVSSFKTKHGRVRQDFWLRERSGYLCVSATLAFLSPKI